MHYKLTVNANLSNQKLDEIWETLKNIIDKNRNINYEKHPEPFIEEENSLILINSVWGQNRPEMDDVEELSRRYPDYSFSLTQASNVLNGEHFETLGNYAMSVFENGNLTKILKPKPVEWETVREFKTRSMF